MKSLAAVGGPPRGAWAALPPRDDVLLAATLDTAAATLTAVQGPTGGCRPIRPRCIWNAGYDSQPCRQALADRGLRGEIAARGLPTPVQGGRRWVIERTHAWGNQYGKLRWCTERRTMVVCGSAATGP